MMSVWRGVCTIMSVCLSLSVRWSLSVHLSLSVRLPMHVWLWHWFPCPELHMQSWLQPASPEQTLLSMTWTV